MKSQFIRPKEGRIIGGVCAGLADYFNIDVVIIRLIFVVMLISGGAGAVVYIILLIVMPEEDGKSYADSIKNEVKGEKKEKVKKDLENSAKEIKKSIKEGRGNTVFAYLLIMLGALLLVGNLFPKMSFDKVWPLYLVIIGIIILLPSKRKD